MKIGLDTKLSKLISEQSEFLKVKFAEDGIYDKTPQQMCQAVAWMSTLGSNITIRQAMVLFEKEIEKNRRKTRWAVELLASQHENLDEELKLKLWSLIEPEQVKTVVSWCGELSETEDDFLKNTHFTQLGNAKRMRVVR